jgi:hypothetical protein
MSSTRPVSLIPLEHHGVLDDALVHEQFTLEQAVAESKCIRDQKPRGAVSRSHDGPLRREVDLERIVEVLVHLVQRHARDPSRLATVTSIPLTT